MPEATTVQEQVVETAAPVGQGELASVREHREAAFANLREANSQLQRENQQLLARMERLEKALEAKGTLDAQQAALRMTSKPMPPPKLDALGPSFPWSTINIIFNDRAYAIGNSRMTVQRAYKVGEIREVLDRQIQDNEKITSPEMRPKTCRLLYMNHRYQQQVWLRDDDLIWVLSDQGPELFFGEVCEPEDREPMRSAAEFNRPGTGGDAVFTAGSQVMQAGMLGNKPYEAKQALFPPLAATIGATEGGLFQRPFEVT